ncbi:hypothetical protein [Nocardiopsis flavescens]|uniref:hypothetical protein n=1 Tax=Nocardiopsis flavescens TaxID=758803 RepID=UPI00116130E4|nr:hypothetical protein [Nocardiopsis flavescens]
MPAYVQPDSTKNGGQIFDEKAQALQDAIWDWKKEVPGHFYDHAVVGGSCCMVVCGAVEFHDGVISTTVGGIGVGAGWYGGYSHMDPRGVGPFSPGACAAYKLGGCFATQTVRENGTNVTRGARGMLEAGFGLKVGADWGMGGLDLHKIPVSAREERGVLRPWAMPLFLLFSLVVLVGEGK